MKTIFTKTNISASSSDIFGGFASMLVALPSAIAFGLIIFAPMGPEFAGRGAVSGMIGAGIIGLIAALAGGAPGLISAPCAPAAALLAAFTTQAVTSGSVPLQTLPLYLILITFGAGAFQIISARLGGGRFIKYIPYPVVAGYLSGVGLIIFIGQMPKLLGTGKQTSFVKAIVSPNIWQWENIAIGVTTIAAMLIAPKVIKALPASIAALTAGVTAYFAIAFFHPEMLNLHNNSFVIGEISASSENILSSIISNFSAVPSLDTSFFSAIAVPVFSLGILLSVDTLKTCVVLDVLSGSRHNSNRELFGQGLANITSAVFGGAPGSGTMGGTLVNFYSGGRTRLSGVVAGISSIAVLLAFSSFIAWIPVAALAGVLLVVAVRMIDWKSINLLKHRSTAFDFAVILAVIVSAISISLIAAAGVGIAFSIILFLRDQIRFPVVRRLSFGCDVFSKKTRPPSEQALLIEKGRQIVIVELQGQLFFGTTDQLYREIEAYFKSCRYFIFDMRRILSVDFTAAKMLSQLQSKISEHGGVFIFSSVPKYLPSGQNVKKYLFKQGFVKDHDSACFFDETTDALEWAEDEILRNYLSQDKPSQILEISDFDFFKTIPDSAIDNIRSLIRLLSIEKNGKIFEIGDQGDEIFFIRKGEVKILLPIGEERHHHLATFTRGAFFGDMAFLDSQKRSADAVASCNTELFVISRKDFEKVREKYPDVAAVFFERLSLEISKRMRLNLAEIRALDEI